MRWLFERLKRLYFDFKYWKLNRVRTEYRIWKNKNVHAIFKWLRECNELVYYAPDDRKERYWHGLGAIEPLPECMKR